MSRAGHGTIFDAHEGAMVGGTWMTRDRQLTKLSILAPLVSTQQPALTSKAIREAMAGYPGRREAAGASLVKFGVSVPGHGWQ
jgi:hypothetical protein